MSRAELWKALAEATDTVQTAGDDYAREATPQTREASDAAFRQYVKRLTPVVGQVEARKYEASLAAYQEAIDRLETLNSTLSVLPSMDDADRQRVRQLTDEQTAARKAFEDARVALDVALEKTAAYDNRT